ncbi:hypothetical protein EUV02_15465 [Polymorphobacter arshaanensis]|uniref:Uncharacterized protein n=1 Tax=Glacieibacterium arshaanense TaxID=2511025 RepID=A0A4Y9EKC7_9SPHN|nr:hypothetical protein [Polymorphobacter arshaanensis]TFU00044.1 hypothetical protein EUV02_15465 [Polymorphobacter arshaanensis]
MVASYTIEYATMRQSASNRETGDPEEYGVGEPSTADLMFLEHAEAIARFSFAPNAAQKLFQDEFIIRFLNARGLNGELYELIRVLYDENHIDYALEFRRKPDANTIAKSP